MGFTTIWENTYSLFTFSNHRRCKSKKWVSSGIFAIATGAELMIFWYVDPMEGAPLKKVRQETKIILKSFLEF